MRLVYNRQSHSCAADNQRTVNPPCDLLVAPLRPVGASVLEGFEHQQVALPVAQQQVRISPTGGIQETFHSLGRKIRSLRSRSPTKSQKLTPHCFTFQSVFFFSSPPSAGGQVPRFRPWSSGPGPQPPAGCGATASGGSWRGTAGWREGAAPGRPCTCRRSEPRRRWPRPAAVLTKQEMGLVGRPPRHQSTSAPLRFTSSV